METKGNYFLIGLFVLAGVAATFSFVIWLMRGDINRVYDYYDVFFEGSVAGLAIGGDVRYRGIKVGSIANIAIDPERPDKAGVTVEIDHAVPLREGDIATLELQGITGIAYIDISGATADSVVIEGGTPEQRTVIPSKPSNIEALFSGAPQMIAKANSLLERVNDLINDENRATIKSMLDDAHAITSTLGSRADQLGDALDSFDHAGEEVALAATGLRELGDKANTLFEQAGGTLNNVDELLAKDAKRLVADLRAASQSVSTFATTATGVFDENRDTLRQFTNEGLPDFVRFLNETRLLVANLSRLSERIEEEGARFLLDKKRSEFQAQ